MKTLSGSEEHQYEELIKSFKDQGINVIASQMAYHELALHYCNKYGIMALKISSKYETRRFALSVGADLINICRKAETEVPTGFCSLIRV